MSQRSRSASVSKPSKKNEDPKDGSDRSSSSDPTSTKSKKSKGKEASEESVDGQSTLDSHFLTPASPAETMGKQLKELTAALANLPTKDFIDSRFGEMGTQLKDLENEMKAEIKKEVEKINKEVSDLKVRVNTVEEKVESLHNKVSDMETSISLLEEENVKLAGDNEKMKEQLAEREAKIIKQSDDINNLEQYTRKNSVRIYGIEDNNSKETAEESAKAVVKMISSKLSLKISRDDIDMAHRLGKFAEDGNRIIICKFISRFKKQEVIRARRALKGSNFIIREDLTILNAKLLEDVSDLDNVISAWSDNGKIIALLNNGKKMVVTKKTDLSIPPWQ